MNLSKKTIISFLFLFLLVIGVVLAVFLSQQTQDVRQQAATEPDLIVESFQLTDAGGNVRTIFNPNEDIYVRITLKNKGGARAESTDGYTYTAIYSHKSLEAPFASESGVTIIMKNGEFGAGSSFTYSSIYGSANQFRFTKAFSWRRSTPGKYTARAFINYNKFAAEGESLYNNNQLTFSYTIADPSTPTYIKGKFSTTAPSGFSASYCTEPTSELVSGLRGCVMDKPVNGKNYGRVRNTGTTTRTVGMASYKAYLPYPNPYPSSCPATDTSCIKQYNWIWTQTIHSAVTYDLPPGKTVYFEVAVPDCAWQTDVFEGTVFMSFQPPPANRFYSGRKTYLDGYYHIIPVCQPVIPSPTPTDTPTPTNTPSPTPSVTPTPLPSNSPTPTVTPTPTPSPTPPVGGPPPTETPTPTRPPSPTPTATATPTPSSCPVPGQVLNVRITCPNCSSVQ